MNTFNLISCSLIYILTFLCFFIPFKCGQKAIGKTIGLLLTIIITSTIIWNPDFLVIFIFILIIVFQIVFITYWTFRFYGRRKIGRIVSVLMIIGFILLVMSPWISDWTYNKKDVRKVLSFHNFEPKEDFKILKNESGGFRDFYETFTIKLSDNDFNEITRKITKSKNYKGYFKDYNNLPYSNYDKKDTADFETLNFYEREYFSNKSMDNGTFHFRFQIDKQNKNLSYTGSDE